jgi:3-carboxy-cis,cis-muconate cycloisomerase
MRANLDATGGLLLAERVTTALAPHTGRLAVHDAVTACAREATAGHRDFADLLAAHPLIGTHLTRDQITELLDPAGYLGSARTFADRALDAHRKRRR